MKIAYRRMSGAIGLTTEEKGTRGLWWDKRIALFKVLAARGHEIDLCSRMTKASRDRFRQKNLRKDHQILMIEFGSSNESFYGEDIVQTMEMVRKHKGKVVFLCDDPDLPFCWKKLFKDDLDRWECWYNATKGVPFGGQPEEIKIMDFPFASLMTPKEPQNIYNAGSLVYLGRPNGREKVIKKLVAGKIPFIVGGRREEWKAFPEVMVVDAPDQPFRPSFYAMSMGSLVLADTKHKRMGWRTGRAFHAIMAGCPAVAEYDHEALAGLPGFEDAEQLRDLITEWCNPKKRKYAWALQKDWVKAQAKICEKTLENIGL